MRKNPPDLLSINMILTKNKKYAYEINDYRGLEELIIKSSSYTPLPFKNYDNVRDFFDEILKRDNIGVNEFLRKWKSFCRENYPVKSSRCVDYYILRGYTTEEATDLISNQQKKNCENANTPETISKRVATWKKNTSEIKSQRGREFYRLKGLSEEEIVTKIQKRNDKWMQSLEEYVERTGDNYHERKGWGYDYMRDKHGHEKAMEIMEARGNPYSNMVKMYGDDWKQHYIDTRYSRKNLTKKYGAEKANDLIYQMNRRRMSNNTGMSSKIELDFYDTLGEGWKQQFVLRGDNNMVYFYDFYNKNTKQFIEFQGDYWHCNPLKYEACFFHTLKQKYAHEIWEYDLQKKIQAEKHGWQVEYVWESDFLKTRIQSDHAVN